MGTHRHRRMLISVLSVFHLRYPSLLFLLFFCLWTYFSPNRVCLCLFRNIHFQKLAPFYSQMSNSILSCMAAFTDSLNFCQNKSNTTGSKTTNICSLLVTINPYVLNFLYSLPVSLFLLSGSHACSLCLCLFATVCVIISCFFISYTALCMVKRSIVLIQALISCSV